MTARHGYTGHEMLDEVGVINMNGRMYDPLLGRFMSADPNIQSPYNLQSYNRYAYAWNDPMGGIDPSGYSWWTDFRDEVVKPAIAIAAAVYAPQISAYIGWTSAAASIGLSGTVASGMLGGALAGGIMSGTAQGALIGGLTGGAFGYVGDTWASGFGNIAGHAVVGCASSSLSGGGCGSGALSGGFGSFATQNMPGAFQGNRVYEAAYVTVVGGTVSVIGGGKFANGAETAAFGYLFNCWAHECLLHYMEGSGKPLTARFDELGADNVTPEMFKQVRGLAIAGTPDGEYSINDKLGWQTDSLNARAAYGRVVLQLQGTLTVSQGAYSFRGSLSAVPDKYDFDPQPWGVRTPMGEVSTRAGALLPGRSFNNVFVGDRLLRSGGALR